MKKVIQKLSIIIMVMSLSTIANAAIKDERIILKKGKSKSEITLNPSRTYRFVINGKQFKKGLKIALQTSSKNIHVKIQSPRSKTLTSGIRKSFSIKNVGSGDYQIILKNTGSKSVSLTLKSWSISGDAD